MDVLRVQKINLNHDGPKVEVTLYFLVKNYPLHFVCFEFMLTLNEVGTMAISVVEFSREGYTIRKVFGQKSTLVK